MKNNVVIEYETDLIEGIIKRRKSQFTIDVFVNDEVINCHCPTTGRIGNIDLCNVPCLLSKSNNPKRKTKFTVEAISLDFTETKNKSWIGINQNAINRYVENAFLKNFFRDMLNFNGEIIPEQKLGLSKLDFLVENTYIEVKTPLQNIQLPFPEHIKTKKIEKFNSTSRFIKHINELANSLKNNQRAILLLCFMYNNPGFRVELKSTNSKFVNQEVKKCISTGIEIWQVNFEISRKNIKLTKYFEITNDFIES